MAYQKVNPANNQLIKAYPSHTDADVEAALKTADALYHSEWAKGDISQRLPVLHKLADLIDSPPPSVLFFTKKSPINSWRNLPKPSAR